MFCPTHADNAAKSRNFTSTPTRAWWTKGSSKPSRFHGRSDQVRNCSADHHVC